MVVYFAVGEYTGYSALILNKKSRKQGFLAGRKPGFIVLWSEILIVYTKLIRAWLNIISIRFFIHIHVITSDINLYKIQNNSPWAQRNICGNCMFYFLCRLYLFIQMLNYMLCELIPLDLPIKQYSESLS